MLVEYSESAGRTFFARSCNSSTPGLCSSLNQPDGLPFEEGPGCMVSKTDYVQVINTKTGPLHDLGQATSPGPVSFFFEPCDMDSGHGRAAVDGEQHQR